jgi:hypothetical protein
MPPIKAAARTHIAVAAGQRVVSVRDRLKNRYQIRWAAIVATLITAAVFPRALAGGDEVRMDLMSTGAMRIAQSVIDHQLP